MSFIEKLKERFKRYNVKTLLKFMTLLWAVALIVLMTLAHVGLDPENMDFNTWLSKAVLMIGISIFGLVMGEGIGRDKQMGDPNGLFQRNMAQYNEVREQIRKNEMCFGDFLNDYRIKETEKKKLNYLMNNGVEKAEEVLKYIQLSDLDELAQHPIKLENGTIIRQLGEEQIKAIKKVLKGKIIVEASNNAYYLSAYSHNTETSILEVGSSLDKAIKSNLSFNRTFKLLTSILFSLIWAMVTVDDFISGDNIAAWVDLISRLMTLFSCLFSGLSSARIDVKLKAKQLENKYIILRQFKESCDSGLVNKVSYEEKAKQEYETYLKQGKENANERDSVGRDVGQDKQSLNEREQNVLREQNCEDSTKQSDVARV